MSRKSWTQEELAILKRDYPLVCGKVIAKNLNVSHSKLLNKAFGLGLKKDKVFLQQAGERLRESGKAHRFEKGIIPLNKGKKWDEYMSKDNQQKSLMTTFKKGQNPHNALVDGQESLRPDNRTGRVYTMVKVPGERKLKFKHIHLWETHNNKKLEKGFVIIFKDGDTKNFEYDNLECISKAENMRRNTIQRYPLELKEQIFKIAKLKRTIKKLEK